MSNIAPIRGRMTEADYDRERAELPRIRKEAGAHFDQALASLFYRSGWTQEQLAKKEGVSKSQVDRSLRFGRFLNFPPNGGNPENTLHALTEGKFRTYWDRTDKAETNERIRFKAVQEQVAAAALTLIDRKRPTAIPTIKEQFADGKWHGLAVIAKQVGVEEDQIERSMITLMQGKQAERKQVGKSYAFRIFRQEKHISSHELMEKLGPIIENLKAEGKKNTTTMSPPTVAHLAGQLQKLLDQWTK